MITFDFTQRALAFMKLSDLVVRVDGGEVEHNLQDGVLFVKLPDALPHKVQLLEPARYRSKTIMAQPGDQLLVDRQVAYWNPLLWLGVAVLILCVYLLQTQGETHLTKILAGFALSAYYIYRYLFGLVILKRRLEQASE